MSDGIQAVPSTGVYEIKTIDDFLRIPAHAIDKALEEFVPAMKTAYAMYRMAVTLAEVAGVSPDTVLMEIPAMRFVDDDRKTITFNLKPNDPLQTAERIGGSLGGLVGGKVGG